MNANAMQINTLAMQICAKEKKRKEKNKITKLFIYRIGQNKFCDVHFDKTLKINEKVSQPQST